MPTDAAVSVPMKFGLFYLPTYLPALRDAQTHYRGIIEQIEFADRIGIDYAWIVEHHFVRHGGLFPSNFAFLSYLAARTKRIRLGTGATVLPLNDPVRVAEQAATLDQLSQGRFDFGVGRGFIRDEFDIFGIDMKESRERVEEGVELVKQAWARPDHGVQQQVPAAAQRHAAAAADLPEAASADLGRLPDVAGELRMDRAARLQPALRRLPRRPPDRRRAHRLVSRRAAQARPQASRTTRSAASITRIFWRRDDTEALQAIVHQPMSEYAAAGIEAARKPPDPTAYKGYERREAGQRDFGFELVLSRPRRHGRAEPGDRAHARLARRRHHPDRPVGGLRLAAAGAHHGLAARVRRTDLAARAGYIR